MHVEVSIPFFETPHSLFINFSWYLLGMVSMHLLIYRTYKMVYQGKTQHRFIHHWLVTGIQCLMCWRVLVHSDQVCMDLSQCFFWCQISAKLPPQKLKRKILSQIPFYEKINSPDFREHFATFWQSFLKFWDGFYIASFLLFGQLLNRCQLMLNIFKDDG